VSLVSPQILLVAAAGNHGNIEQLKAEHSPLAADWTTNLTDTTPVWPAAFAEVTAVGATDRHGQRAEFSPEVPWIDVTAPGVDVESTYLDGEVRLTIPNGNPTEVFHGSARWQGTSFAAASVSGAVAAKIEPGSDARRALKAVLADRKSGIRRFSKA
jgi:subtilisin family serine protease